MLVGALDANKILEEPLIIPRFDAMLLDVRGTGTESGKQRLAAALANFESLSDSFKNKYTVTSDVDESIANFNAWLYSSDVDEDTKTAAEAAWEAYEAKYTDEMLEKV